jgi:hypothetical protein
MKLVLTPQEVADILLGVVDDFGFTVDQEAKPFIKPILRSYGEYDDRTTEYEGYEIEVKPSS